MNIYNLNTDPPLECKVSAILKPKSGLTTVTCIFGTNTMRITDF